MKIVFFGTPSFVDPVIDSLDKNFELVKVIRSPEQWNNETIEMLKKLSPDFFVVASYGKILPEKILEIPKYGAINIHPSLLPKYRGPSPIREAILNWDETTGISIMKMDEQMDHGPLLGQFEEEIFSDDTFESLAKRLFTKSTNALVRVITDYETIKPEIQDDSKATYTKLLTKQSGFINLSSENAIEIEKLKLKIRAYYPWPGVWTRFDLNGKGQEKIIKLLPNEMIQVEGRNQMTYTDFINGYPKGKELLEKLNLG